MTDDELRGICNYLIVVAREAGHVVRHAQPTSLTTTSKKNSLYFITHSTSHKLNTS